MLGIRHAIYNGTIICHNPDNGNTKYLHDKGMSDVDY